ncbi:MAG: hypothetical protein QOJ65_1461 [Fimbriimonadaceae bacterium]|jgi:hypothetical protein|nr:hypothetical protein [Fimbriimonadaceae bacterium]
MVLSLIAFAFASRAVLVVGPRDFEGAEAPYAAVSNTGVICVAFGAGDGLYLSQSRNLGKTYEKPRRIGTAPKVMLGMRRGPRITATNDSIVVSAISEGNLLAWKSNDRGESWIGPAQVNDMPDSAREGLHAMDAVGSRVVCAWLDMREKGTQIYAAVSDDGGENWSSNMQVYKSPGGSVCECCHPSVDIDANGVIRVMFRNSLNGNRDMYVVEGRDIDGVALNSGPSAQEGITWGKARVIGKDHWKLDRCPMDGGAISSDDQAHVWTIWRRNTTIYRTLVGSPEEKMGVGVQPWIYAKGGAYGVYLKARPGPMMVLKGTDAARQIAPMADDPMVAGPVSGSGPVVAVWSTPKGEIWTEVLGGIE